MVRDYLSIPEKNLYNFYAFCVCTEGHIYNLKARWPPSHHSQLLKVSSLAAELLNLPPRCEIYSIMFTVWKISLRGLQKEACRLDNPPWSLKSNQSFYFSSYILMPVFATLQTQCPGTTKNIPFWRGKNPPIYSESPNRQASQRIWCFVYVNCRRGLLA